jgi:charged multivesicular body protein 1
MENYLFTLKFTAKQLVRQSKRAEKAEKQEKLKLKKAIEQGDMERARIYAQNAIRQKNQATNYLRLSSRVDAISSRLETAIRMKTVTRAMANIVVAMDKSMQEMNLEKMTQVMDQFEKQFEDLDVQSEYVENTINQTTALTTPQDQVDELIAQVADEHGLELGEQFSQIAAKQQQLRAQKEKEKQKQATNPDQEQDELTNRFLKLKN